MSNDFLETGFKIASDAGHTADKITELNQQLNDVKPWKMFNGKLTELWAYGGPLALRDDFPRNLDPIEVVRNFMQVVDPEKTKLIAKIQHNPQPGRLVERRAVNLSNSRNGNRNFKGRPRNEEDEPRLGFQSNISIYKKYIIGIYRSLPENFISENVTEYFIKMFNNISTPTAKNKATAYVTYMKNNGFIEVTKTFGKKSYYTFTNPPFGALPAAQAEYDPVDMQKRKLIELETMRRTL